MTRSLDYTLVCRVCFREETLYNTQAYVLRDAHEQKGWRLTGGTKAVIDEQFDELQSKENQHPRGLGTCPECIAKGVKDSVKVVSERIFKKNPLTEPEGKLSGGTGIQQDIFYDDKENA